MTDSPQDLPGESNPESESRARLPGVDRENADSTCFRDGEPAVFIDRKHRKYLMFLKTGHSYQLRGGRINSDNVIGDLPGCRVESSSGELLQAYRPTLEEYVLLMPRGAQIVSPKDIGHIVLWGDVFPGAVVVEAGIGSGSLTLGLLRAVGEHGKVISFEIREDFANNARNNISAWWERLDKRLEIRLGDIHEELGALDVQVDRVILDLPDPWNALDGASRALRPGGILISYSPTIRQIDQLVLAILDRPQFSPPDLTEIIARPWVADHKRLRPNLRIIGHTGFLLRTRRRTVKAEE